MTTLGLIAGNGVFPLEVARMARRQGLRTIAVAHLDETDREIAEFADTVLWIKLGELQRIIDVFKEARVEQAAMAGGISRARLQSAFAPDRRALMMLARLDRFSDDAVLRGVAAELESEGIKVIDPVPMLQDILAPAGLLAGPEPTAAQLNDLGLAFAIARALGAFDVGQAVAVRDGVVAAVEAAEGTDAALRRGALLCGNRLVIAKAAKPSQDLRFDRPAIGPATIDLLDELQAAVIGVEAGTAMLLQREATLKRARTCNITVYGYA
ncbi:MAG: UDP-2,3-diacylglucosamine diphosphatase LpxI [Deltaproteobacteria bacterium]|nr:UDP-2,3-diacylglucosamine diphosphatase LpxI [Deltaproteobacteria bacterium]